MLYCAMSATPFAFKPPPTPGFDELTQFLSCVPRPVVSSEPMLSPFPAMAMQLSAVKPALTQLTSLILGLLGIEPAKLKYFDAILPEGASFSKSDVSIHAVLWLVDCAGLLLVSHEKKPKSLFFQIGAPRLPPSCVKKFSSLVVLPATPFHL